MPTFTLDPKIAADTVPIVGFGLSDLRLMNDARFPWLLLVPRVVATEIVDLKDHQRSPLLDEITVVSAALRQATGCHKLNVAALGNVVRQLHIHVIARFTTDVAWPKPVWGVGEALAYPAVDRDRLVRQILAALPI